ncbi:hypothetical protein ACFRKE_16485 [Kitasatospora indigofera]|uniref:hypothetical protein n=1 Tax=Kitasatospora indigofera TaxID=67307 RepID=UPI003657BB40
MLLTWIAELADEPLVLEPADRRVEWETNTWWLSAEAEDRRSLSVAEVVAAFERTAAALRRRIRDTGFAGAATFYVWHDDRAGQLRCSTGSVAPDELPFDGAHVVSGALGPVVEGFLADENPGVVTLSDADEAQEPSERAGADPAPPPLLVWVSSVGTTTG